MKHFLIIVLLAISSNTLAEPNNCNVFATMNENQKDTLKKSFSFGAPYGYQWILPAQAWKESSAGENLYLKDIRGGSHGIYQSLLDNVLWREFEMRLNPKNGEAKAPKWYVDFTKKMLYRSHAFSAKHAILELQFWKARTDTEWGMLASYNGGHKGPKIKQAQQYANKIARYKNLLQTCESSPLYGYE